MWNFNKKETATGRILIITFEKDSEMIEIIKIFLIRHYSKDLI